MLRASQLPGLAVSATFNQYRYISSPTLTGQQAFHVCGDYLVFGNLHGGNAPNRFAEEVIALEPALAKIHPTPRLSTRILTGLQYPYGMTAAAVSLRFTKGSIFHLMEPDINQDLRLPGYLSAIPSSCSTSPRHCFASGNAANGSHAEAQSK